MMSKKILLATIAGGLVLVLPACWPSKKKEETAEMASSQLYVLNVLDPEQYDECHIPGSINVPCDKVAEFAQTADKNAEVVTYCSNYQCSASGHAAKQLKELGFEKVSAYEAGIAEWYQQGLPVEGSVAQGAPASEFLTKLSERSGELNPEVVVVTTESLKEKLVTAGLLHSEEQSSAAAPVA